MLLKTIADGRPFDIPVREGEIFLLPAHVPHSPQRFTNTVGLVIERVRHLDEKDGFIWFCDNCHAPLYSEYLHVSDIEKQLLPVFDRFYENEENRRCSECGQVMAPR
jgi:3-hydroxyanthranilate 3,4-dioxygenase